MRSDLIKHFSEGLDAFIQRLDAKASKLQQALETDIHLFMKASCFRS